MSFGLLDRQLAPRFSGARARALAGNPSETDASLAWRATVARPTPLDSPVSEAACWCRCRCRCRCGSRLGGAPLARRPHCDDGRLEEGVASAGSGSTVLLECRWTVRLSVRPSRGALCNRLRRDCAGVGSRGLPARPAWQRTGPGVGADACLALLGESSRRTPARPRAARARAPRGGGRPRRQAAEGGLAVGLPALAGFILRADTQEGPPTPGPRTVWLSNTLDNYPQAPRAQAVGCVVESASVKFSELSECGIGAVAMSCVMQREPDSQRPVRKAQARSAGSAYACLCCHLQGFKGFSPECLFLFDFHMFQI